MRRLARSSRSRARRNGAPRSACPETAVRLTRNRVASSSVAKGSAPAGPRRGRNLSPVGTLPRRRPYRRRVSIHPHRRTPGPGEPVRHATGNLYSLVMRLVAAGLSFRTAPLAVREAAAIPAARAATTLRYLVGHAGLHGAAVLSTCNRTDFYMVCPDNLSAEVTPRLARYLDPGGVARSRAPHGHARGSRGRAAHVPGGERSGEHGRSARRRCSDSSRPRIASPPMRERLTPALTTSCAAPSPPPSECAPTRRWAAGAASLSEIAVECARASCGDLEGKGVLLVGAGKMSRLAADRLRDEGARIMTTSRGESSRRLARGDRRGTGRARLRSRTLADDVDVIIASTDSSNDCARRGRRSSAFQRRRGRPAAVHRRHGRAPRHRRRGRRGARASHSSISTSSAGGSAHASTSAARPFPRRRRSSTPSSRRPSW